MSKIPCLAIALLIGLATSAAKADTILTYTWSSNASFTNGTSVEDLSGGFSWDATTDTLYSVDTVISGPISFTATVVSAWELSSTTSAIFIRETGAPTYPFAVLDFAGLLEDGGTHDLISVDALSNTTSVSGTSYSDTVYGVSVQGDVVSASVPEPTAMALLSVGLVGLGFTRRRIIF